MESVIFEPLTASATSPQLTENTPVTTTPRSSAALRRLMDEVRFQEINGSSAAMSYDRAHNRHNRS